MEVAEKSEKVARTSWGLALFGMVFVVGGLFAFMSIAGNMLLAYVATSGWDEVPANIHTLELKHHYGDDTTTYIVKGNYSYLYNGNSYQSDRVSLSRSSDNVGSYWEDLHRKLANAKNRDQVLALVNPNNPSEAYLDRTLRWESMVFGFVFSVIFSGIGCLLTWFGLSRPKSRELRLKDERIGGIASDQKTANWFLAGFGGLFFLMGMLFCILALPDALRKGEYGALFILLFVFIGVGMLFYAWRGQQAYQRFGPTPLFLDPAEPGVGGNFGANFKLNNPQLSGVTTPIMAKLSCTRVSKSGDSTSRSLEWQEEAMVYVKHTAAGLDASVLIDIPEDCIPSRKWKNGSAIRWDLTVEGDFKQQRLGLLRRTWSVEIADEAAQISNVISIPVSFLKESDSKIREQAKVAAGKQIRVAEIDGVIDVTGLPGRKKWHNFIGMMVGAIFTGVGVFTLGEWFGAYVFMLLGSLLTLGALYALGSDVEVKINKSHGVVYSRQSWFGFVYAYYQGDLLDPQQFATRKTSSMRSGNKYTEFYAVTFDMNGKSRVLAKGIEGKHAADALKASIIERCFDQLDYASVA